MQRSQSVGRLSQGRPNYPVGRPVYAGVPPQGWDGRTGAPQACLQPPMWPGQSRPGFAFGQPQPAGYPADGRGSGFATPTPPPRPDVNPPMRGMGLDSTSMWQNLDASRNQMPPPSPQPASPQPATYPSLQPVPVQPAAASSAHTSSRMGVWSQVPGQQLPVPVAEKPMPKVDSEGCFAMDVSCVGERAVGYGNVNGYEVEESCTFTKLGSQNHALLVSTKGFTTGVHYWEFIDRVADPGADVGFRIGVVPRSACAALNIDGDLRENGGYGEAFAHGGGTGDICRGDRIGALLDLSGTDGKLSFFVNGRFADVPSISALRKDRPLFPAFCTMGHSTARVSFEVLYSPNVPDIVLHSQQELQWLQKRREQELTLKDPVLDKIAPALGPLPPHEEQRRVAVAMAHTGGTVEVSSQPMEELRLRAGDAILFVEQTAPGGGREWLFEIENEEVLARDFFYVHVEFDQHAAQDGGLSPGSNSWALKLAFKFVAMQPGKAILKSKYGRPNTMEPWTQALPVTVLA